MIRWAYGKRIFEGPAPEHLVMQAQGTTVKVDGLWADLPVRRKAWEASDPEKEMEAAVKVVVELLMSGRAVGVGVVMRDEKGERKLVVKPNGGEKWDLRVLKMTGVAEMEGWEPVKAKQRGVGIEGWICKKGSVGKVCQFLCELMRGVWCPFAECWNRCKRVSSQFRKYSPTLRGESDICEFDIWSPGRS